MRILNSKPKKKIDGFDKNYFLNVSEEDLEKNLISLYSVNPPVINEDKIYGFNQSEFDIEVSYDPMRSIPDRNRPSFIKGSSITISIPFDGDETFFNYQPSSFTINPPQGEIRGKEVLLVLQIPEHNAAELNKSIARDINEIKKLLEFVKKDSEIFNRDIAIYIRESVRRRKEKLLKELETVRNLGIPIRRRDTILNTYTVPEIRKKPKINRTYATEKPFKPEPANEMKEYENILSIIRNMVLVMERSPRAFRFMKEDDLRQHFLVQLNAQYEGTTTGETFNYEGKTDILIRFEGKNLFIAECKFWKGEKALLDAIDQLLGYTSWRDTKTAILVFNRNKNLSNVLGKIHETVKSHSCYKRETSTGQKTEFRYIFHNPVDKNQELIITVMVFDVPD